ncbi:MAG TPA: hypothetical protein VNY05_01855 [Candidatus Acidoferrales bacterium]|nr:hypothetical protein [Candidatus Acidoferrales bacterium]
MLHFAQFYILIRHRLPSRFHVDPHVPKMWEHIGIPFGALIDRRTTLALDRHRQKLATRFTC